MQSHVRAEKKPGNHGSFTVLSQGRSQSHQERIMDLELYRKVFSINAAEDLIIRDYHMNEMKTPMHMSRGEESLVCAVEDSLPPGSFVATTYRSHALYLARTGDFFGFFCEMLGRTDGCSGGRAGSMHLSAISSGMLSSSAIVGGNISVAVGAGFGLSRSAKDPRVSAVFFGDGATDAGTFWESLNLAKLYKTPTIFVCCDNKLAVHSGNVHRKGWDFQNVGDIVTRLGIPYHRLTGACVFSLSKQMAEVFASNGLSGPLFVHGEWFRFLEHVGIDDDFCAGYRPRPSEKFMDEWDPVKKSRETLLASGVTEERIVELEHEVTCEAENSLSRARKVPFASETTVYNHVFG